VPFSSTAPRRLPYGLTRRAGGTLIALSIGVLIVTLFVRVLAAAEDGGAGSGADIWHLLRMTTIQAGLTTILSLIAGLVVAWALNRLRFAGRDLIASLFATAIVAPGIVVAFGLIAVWGRAGWIGRVVEFFGGDWTASIFGLHGILAAHVILDAAFAARVLLTRLDAVPAARLKTGQALALGPLTRIRVIDWPAMSGALPGLGAIIFLLAFTSFPVVLVLGGGPANQTLEVAIYSAVRLSFDLTLAVQLALIQLGICLLVIGPALYFLPDISTGGTSAAHHWPDPPVVRMTQILALALALFGFGLPLIAVIADGLGAIPDVIAQARFWRAMGTSLAISTLSAGATIAIAIVLVLARTALAGRWPKLALGLPAFVYLVVPAVVLSLGFFLTVRSLGIAPIRAAPIVLIVANALLALPFAMSVLVPAVSALDRRYGKAAQSLGLDGWRRWRYVEAPMLRPDLALVFALAFCFSLGDLGVISLFGTGDFSTLPWLMYRSLGAYRTNDAAAIAAVMMLMILAVFWLAPKLAQRGDDA